jgi:small subunit ribosomal protein S2
VGKLADAIYEGRHGQLDAEEDYEDYEGAEEEFEYDETELVEEEETEA